MIRPKRKEIDSAMKLLIIVPAYNEALNISAVIENLRSNYSQYDYVVIDDGSKDETASICREHGYHLISLPVNLGLAGAFQTGMRYADAHDYDYAIQLDADGQHDPRYISDMVKKMEEGYDIVIGSRYETEKKPFNARMIGSRMIGTAIRLTTRQKLSDPTSGMRLYGRRMIREFARNINYGPEPDTVSFLAKQGVPIASVQVTMQERTAGESYLNFSRSMLYMLRVMLSILLINNFRK